MPYIGIPFPEAPEAGRLVMQLPPRFFPGRVIPFWRALLMGVLPALLALLLGVLVYRQLMRPLRALEAQVLRFRDDPQARVAPELAARRDEVGQVAESFNLMAERVAGVLGAQRQLLHDMSHELRTPLSRLSVALDGQLSENALRERVARELALMSALVDDTLELAWHDMVQRVSATEPVTLGPMWDLVVENVAFEAGWPVSRFPNRLPEDARVRAHVNDLARTLENLVRNAVRHSPPEGEVSLEGHCEGGMWHLMVADQGPGVAPEALTRIFEPFVRLDTAREQGSGFGLGLSIARRAVVRQGGSLWAENGAPGLRVHLRLPAVT
jgi:two-component system, OmpR family, sensor histidine kinase PfeS